MLSARDIADRLNLRRHPRSWRGRCPACDDSGETFSIREREGRLAYFCANGCDRNALCNALWRVLGGSWQPPQHRAEAADKTAQRARKQALAAALWNGSEPAAGTLAERYLAARRLPGLASSKALRFRADTAHLEGGRLPAMVASVTDSAGIPIAVHRTYFRGDGTAKADAEPAKASLGPVWGGAIRLDPLASELVIGEGIESSASAGRLLGLPAWSAISSGNLGRGLVLPSEVRTVVIAADPDDAGQDAARAAWHRWTAERRRVRVATPDGSGDFNDLLRAREVAHA